MKGHVYKPGCKCPKAQKCKCGAKWGFLVDVGINPATGKRKQKFKGGFSTKKEAEAAKVTFLAEVQAVGFVDPSKAMFADIANEWLESYAADAELKPGTIRIRKHEIGRLNLRLKFARIKDISAGQYQEALRQLKEEDGFADNTMSGLHGTARMIFKYARKMEYIKKDPTEFARVPRSKKTVEQIEGKAELPKYMEKHELAQFLKTAEERGLDRDYEFFCLLAYSGIRVGELLALKWSDLDFEKGIISITKTLYNPKNNPLSFELLTPKTKRSVRKIVMDDEVMKLLKSLKIRQAEFKLRTPEYFDGGFVSAIIGNRKNPGYPDVVKVIALRMQRINKLAGLSESFTPHTFRHTHTSLLAEARATLDSIMERLGHADDEVTRLIYTHVTQDLKKEAAQRFSDLMNGLR